eukprot:TRINITY_DN5234_c0_g1_i3.p1 TRINITY_DN5234_c0_g1~~TRINITY_DN5234_c0_g1_i3.p1  ORF type:complete len:410 (-),score=77.24 TRINITY_DN5234_c0_g1_i3:192-1421(-)
MPEVWDEEILVDQKSHPTNHSLIQEHLLPPATSGFLSGPFKDTKKGSQKQEIQQKVPKNSASLGLPHQASRHFQPNGSQPFNSPRSSPYQLAALQRPIQKRIKRSIAEPDPIIKSVKIGDLMPTKQEKANDVHKWKKIGKRIEVEKPNQDKFMAHLVSPKTSFRAQDECPTHVTLPQPIDYSSSVNKQKTSETSSLIEQFKNKVSKFVYKPPGVSKSNFNVKNTKNAFPKEKKPTLSVNLSEPRLFKSSLQLDSSDDGRSGVHSKIAEQTKRFSFLKQPRSLFTPSLGEESAKPVSLINLFGDEEINQTESRPFRNQFQVSKTRESLTFDETDLPITRPTRSYSTFLGHNQSSNLFDQSIGSPHFEDRGEIMSPLLIHHSVDVGDEINDDDSSAFLANSDRFDHKTKTG